MKGDEEIKAVCTCVLPYQILSVGELSGKAFTRTQLQAAFFRLYFHASVLRTTAGAASGAARKKTATRYATVGLMMMNALVEVQWSTKGVALLAAES